MKEIPEDLMKFYDSMENRSSFNIWNVQRKILSDSCTSFCPIYILIKF